MSDDKGSKKSAAEAEAAGDATVDIEFDGHTYTVPTDLLDCPIEVVEAFEQGRHVSAIEGIVGPAEWVALKQRFRAGHDGRFTARDLEPFAGEIAEALGLASPGE